MVMHRFRYRAVSHGTLMRQLPPGTVVSPMPPTNPPVEIDITSSVTVGSPGEEDLIDAMRSRGWELVLTVP